MGKPLRSLQEEVNLNQDKIFMNLSNVLCRASSVVSKAQNEFVSQAHEYAYFSTAGYKNSVKELEEKLEAAKKGNDSDQIKGLEFALSNVDDHLKKEKINFLKTVKNTYLVALCASRCIYSDPAKGISDSADLLEIDETLEFPDNQENIKKLTTVLGNMTYIMYYLDTLDPKITEEVDERIRKEGFDSVLNAYNLVTSAATKKKDPKAIAEKGKQLLELTYKALESQRSMGKADKPREGLKGYN